MHLDNRTRIFLFLLVGTWGQLLFPKPWKEFRFWDDEHKAKDIKPFLNGVNERALSVSHQVAGVNYGNSARPDSQLLDESSLDFNFLEMQPLSNLKSEHG